MRETASKIAYSFLGVPYMWGGDDPMAGFDCSGFVIEILKSVGYLPRNGDWTAEGLWMLFKDRKKQVLNPCEGSLVFYNNTNKIIIHVEYCLSADLSIGASGGESGTVTNKDAIDNNAYVKVRPIRSRKNIHGFMDPFQ